VTTAGNDNQFEAERRFIPPRLIAEYVLPSPEAKPVELVLKQQRGPLLQRNAANCAGFDRPRYSIEVRGASGGGRCAMSVCGDSRGEMA
jgi:hypothetical protein